MITKLEGFLGTVLMGLVIGLVGYFSVFESISFRIVGFSFGIVGGIYWWNEGEQK